MDRKHLNNFIDGMKNAMYEAGKLAQTQQSTIKNIGKNAENLSGDNEYTKKCRTAKTIIDEKIQEILLIAATKLLDAPNVNLDAEENTFSKKYFSSTFIPNAAVLIIDPIDATLDYLLGNSSYRINVGLVEKGAVLASLIYFPARKEFYFIKNNNAYCEKSGKLYKLSVLGRKKDNFVYVNSRVDDHIIYNLNKGGYKIVNYKDGIVDYTDALMKCITGEYILCIFHTPQTRDVLLGAIITAFPGSYMCDWKGNKISWPNGGRIPQVIFGFGTLPKKVLKSLKI